MRNLFYYRSLFFGVRFEKRDDKFVEDGVGWQREHRETVVWCFFLLCLVSIIEKGEQELMITWDLDVFCNKGLQNIFLLLYMCYFLVKICGCVRF